MRWLPAVLGLMILATAASAGEIDVGAGSSLDLGSATVDLGCADVIVGGTLDAGSGTVARARDVTVVSGGLLSGGSSLLNVAGDWDNAGSFVAGASHVRFLDDCGRTSATLTGSNSFYDLEVTSSIGKLYVFEAGSTQAIASSLTLAGNGATRLVLRSTTGGNEAFTDLQGSQFVSSIDIQDNHSIGQQIVLDEQSVDSGNTAGWTLASLIPTLPAAALLGMALAIAAAMLRASR
jgi:hypothetical protein